MRTAVRLYPTDNKTDGTMFDSIDNIKVNGDVVPEPQEYALLAGLGLVAFAAYRRFRK